MKKKQGTCNSVIDGDTIKLKGLEESLRLAGVEAPELNEPGGQAAKRKLEALVLNKTVEYEQVAWSYGRIVAEVWVNGRSVNEAMRKYLKG